jgi:UDP-2,3-diacylglucosamine hydrolase
VLAALADLRESGIPILWIAGNHDCWGGDILREDVGADYHVGPWSGEIAGWRARIEHGDGLRPAADRRYRLLRSVLRHPISIRLFRMLHPDLGTRLASGSSHASRIHRAGDEGAELREIGLRRIAENSGLDLVVFGHSHAAALARGAHGAVYANAGTWLEAPTFLHVTPNRIELRRWSGSAEGECLDAVDRRAEEALAEA